MKIKLSKVQWEGIGRKAGWMEKSGGNTTKKLTGIIVDSIKEVIEKFKEKHPSSELPSTIQLTFKELGKDRPSPSSTHEINIEELIGKDLSSLPISTEINKDPKDPKKTINPPPPPPRKPSVSPSSHIVAPPPITKQKVMANRMETA